MEYTFVKPVNVRTGIIYDWCLKVSDMKTLLSYEEKISGENITSLVSEISPNYTKHHSFEYLLSKLMACNNESSIVESYVKFHSDASNGRFKIMQKHGAIYIQQSRGYFCHSEDIKITAEIKTNEIIYPQGKGVRYIKWPEGKHWYAKIGNLDVKVDGKMKWDTKEEAEKAVKKFVLTITDKDCEF